MNSLVVSATKVICLDPTESEADWLEINEGTIVRVGYGDPPQGRAVELDGYLLPGLIDAHIHLTTTGLYDQGLDFRASRSIPELLSTLRGFLKSRGEDWVIGGNFDPGRNKDPRMPTRDELDPLTRSRPVLISRADGHSCVLNSAALAIAKLDDSLAGIGRDQDRRPTGVLTNESNYAARKIFFGALPQHQIVDAQKAACRLALSRGVTCAHEMAGGTFMGNEDLKALLRHRLEYPIEIKPYVATQDIGEVLGYGLDCIGGDLFLDGSIGSRTAAMTEPYEGGLDEYGSLYHSDQEVEDFFFEASRAGLQAGVHAIGDAAIEQAISAIERAFARLGPEGILGARKLRHRIEHFECVSQDHLERAARLGLAASVQPAFDDYWGGLGNMYNQRLGERALRMNPFSHMLQQGLLVAGGSDSTVTPLDPFQGMAAAIGHSNPKYRVSNIDAMRMFTTWAAEAGHQESERGSIEPGKRADLTLVSEDPLRADAAMLKKMQVQEVWVAGSRVWSA